MENAFPKPWEIHPMLVHFPIAFLIGGVAVMVWALFRPTEGTHRIATGLLVAGVISGWVAAASGGLAYMTVPAHTEVGHDLMYWHLGFALATLLLFTGVSVVRSRVQASKATMGQAATVMVGFLCVIATGHLGGTIVLRNGAGVDPNILSAEIRAGHSHQGGHSHAAESMPSMNRSAPGQHDMAGMKDMPGMDHASIVQDEKETKTSLEGLSHLSDADRDLAVKQNICPVSGELIGAMGKPIKVTVKDRVVWLCCDSCKKKLLQNPDEYSGQPHAHSESE